MNESNSDTKETLKTAQEFFGGAVETKKKIKLPEIKGPVIEVGEIFSISYTVNEADGLKGYDHRFEKNKIITKPGANWFLVTGDFKFTKQGFVNK